MEGGGRLLRTKEPRQGVNDDMNIQENVIQGIPTDVIETGRFYALAPPVAQSRLRPAKGGASVGFIGNLSSPAPVAAAVGMKVHKHGRTTGYRRGQVVDVAVDVNITYDFGTARFTDQITVDPISLKRRLSPLVLSVKGVSGVGVPGGRLTVYLETEDDTVRASVRQVVAKAAPGTTPEFVVTGSFKPQ